MKFWSFFWVISDFPVMRFTDTHGCWLGSESDSLVVAPKVGMLFRLGRWQPFTRKCDFQAISGPKTCKAPEPTAPTPAPALAPAPATLAPVVSSAGSKHNQSRFHFQAVDRETHAIPSSERSKLMENFGNFRNSKSSGDETPRQKPKAPGESANQ